MTPLLAVESLDDLFEGWQHLPTHRPPLGWYFLGGLPGTVRLKERTFLYVKPRQAVLAVARPYMTNGSVGSFRAVQSAHWMKEGLLPVFVQDTAHIASPLLAFVSQSEHERFNNDF